MSHNASIPRAARPVATLKVKAIVPQDEAYRAVFAEGASAVASQIEGIVYSSDSHEAVIRDLARLVASAHELSEERWTW